MQLNTIYNENCLDTMAKMPDNFIDLVVTSPPYDGLRDYKGYSFPFEQIAKELFRVIKQGGVCVWVVGDETKDFCETLTSFKQAIYFVEECGFKLLDTMIYGKKSYAPAYPTMMRYAQTFEYMFILSKGKPKTFNPIQIPKSNLSIQRDTNGKTVGFRQQNGEIKTKRLVNANLEKSASNLWIFDTGFGKTTTDEIAYNHPAVFPEDLAQDHIYTWSNEGELVYDCFGGSGTTGKMAHLQKRKWILSEVSEEYFKDANKRLSGYLAQTFLF